MSGSPDIAFVACIEPGKLEAQTFLLFESLRQFGGALARAPAYALSPRGRAISPAARQRLEGLQVLYGDRVLNTDCPDYGSANRVAAAGHVEATTHHEILVVLDSDTLFVREPAELLLADDVDAAVRPVDVKGMCTSGPDDPSDPYWRQLCACSGTEYEDLPYVTTTVDRLPVKASYNGGLVVVRTARGLLQRWAELFFRSVRAGLVPRSEAQELRSGAGMVPGEMARFWGSNQAALSVAMWSATRRIVELPPSYNFPLHLSGIMTPEQRAPLRDLVHLHYHWLFDREEVARNVLLTEDGLLPADVLGWLSARVPLGP